LSPVTPDPLGRLRMPRTYRFDHFTVQKRSPSRALLRQAKQKYTELRPESPISSGQAPKLHYGRQHAETEALFQAKEMNAQLEALAGLEQPPEPRRDILAKKPSGPPMQGMPIGALPAAPEMFSPQRVREVVDETLLRVKALRTAVAEAGTATLKIALAPWVVVKLVGQKLATKVRSTPAWI
jgi:hypothetical protein